MGALISPNAVPGRVHVVNTHFNAFARITITPNDPFADERTVMLTSVGIDVSVGMQFMQTLSQRVYVYYFGQRPGTVKIDGIAFIGACVGETGRSGGGRAASEVGIDRGITGLGNLIKYFQGVAGVTSGVPTKVTVNFAGDITLSGFVTRFFTTFKDPKSATVGFTLEITTLLARQQ